MSVAKVPKGRKGQNKTEYWLKTPYTSIPSSTSVRDSRWKVQVGSFGATIVTRRDTQSKHTRFLQQLFQSVCFAPTGRNDNGSITDKPPKTKAQVCVRCLLCSVKRNPLPTPQRRMQTVGMATGRNAVRCMKLTGRFRKRTQNERVAQVQYHMRS